MGLLELFWLVDHWLCLWRIRFSSPGADTNVDGSPQDGSLAAARRRRAAMQEGGADSGSGGEPDSSSDSDSEDERPNGAQAAMVDLDGELSDEEAKAGLRRYQEAKMLAESEVGNSVHFGFSHW